MKQIEYKHKQTGEVVKHKGDDSYYFANNQGQSIHKQFIENTNDWELVVEELTGWYVNKRQPNWLSFIDKDITFGISAVFDWFYYTGKQTYDRTDTPASPETTLKMLSEYATKLGYKEGVKIESLFSNFAVDIISHYGFSLVDNKLWLSDICIMKNGIWAKIVKQSAFTPEQLAELKEMINNK